MNFTEHIKISSPLSKKRKFDELISNDDDEDNLDEESEESGFMIIDESFLEQKLHVVEDDENEEIALDQSLPRKTETKT